MKLSVENLARIKEAEIEVKNLTLFVGQNSTHKSYLAHVVYELYKEVSNIKNNNFQKAILSISKKIHQDFKKDVEYLLSLKREISEEEHHHQISEDDYEVETFTNVKFFIEENDMKLNTFLSNIFDLLLDELTKKINNSFNANSLILDKLFIENHYNILKQEYFHLSFNIPKEYFIENQDEIGTRLVNNIIRSLIDKLQINLQNYNASYYFPASRTGFVLTLDEIYAGIFRDKFRGQVSATRLGEPTIDFIQTFADIKTGKINEFSHYNDFFLPMNNKKNKVNINKLVNFLEKNIIKGKIKEVTNDQDYTSYYLEVNGEELDLHLASSATLEILPFIVFLKNTADITKTVFIIEEPEAHLHPKAQVQMAKFIVLLANSGAKILITTHSDYILNEINNGIKLSSINIENEFAIKQESISAYLLKNERNETIVKELEIDRFGIANDNFDEVLDELLDKSSELSEKILDAE